MVSFYVRKFLIDAIRCIVKVCLANQHILLLLHFIIEKSSTYVYFFRFTLRGKMEPDNSIRMGGCSFELEICYIPAIGIPQTTSETATPTKSILKNGSLNGKLNCNGSSSRCGSVGIRRKRLKGDAWCYKNVCEQVLALTTLELKRPAESSV